MVKPTSHDPIPAPPEPDGDERRKHRRVELPLKARFLNANNEEQACLIVNMSAGGALLKTKKPPAFGSSVVIYVDEMGRFEGKVTRSAGKSFALTYERKRTKSAETADDLTQVLNRGKRTHDRRDVPRIRQEAPAIIFFEDGRTENCAILDISLTGASIEIKPRPPLGTNLILGRMTAKVVRRHDTGVGIVFTGKSNRMDEVISEASAIELPPEPGAPVAKIFGRKAPRG